MSVEQLGTALSAARKARGLTLLEVERDTRISGRYLKALEEGDLDVLPAPVYARAFTRTYAQYLGLNAQALVQELPGAKPEPELPPLPDVARGGGLPLISASWLIGGIVVAVLIVAGLVLLWSRGDDPAVTVTSDPAAVETAQGSDQGAPQDIEAPSFAGGTVPSFENQNALVAIGALQQADVPYVVVEIENDDVPEGTILQQSPSPGTPLNDDTVVTLVISR